MYHQNIRRFEPGIWLGFTGGVLLTLWFTTLCAYLATRRHWSPRPPHWSSPAPVPPLKHTAHSLRVIRLLTDPRNIKKKKWIHWNKDHIFKTKKKKHTKFCVNKKVGLRTSLERKTAFYKLLTHQKKKHSLFLIHLFLSYNTMHMNEANFIWNKCNKNYRMSQKIVQGQWPSFKWTKWD